MTTNAGLGYRILIFDNSVLVGTNAFFDYEWDYNHSRASVGGELRWSGFDLYVNNYWGLSGKHTANGDAFEEPLDGREIELTAQIPYLPWARLRGSRYWWDTISASEDIKGWSGSVELDILQNLQIEAGIKDDNFTEESYFVQLRFRLGAPSRPVLASSRFVDDWAFDMRDMRAHTLDKVRRENKIILERTASGVVITRGN